MVHKRLFDDEESYEHSCKHPRQLEYKYRVGSFMDSGPCNSVSQRPHTSVDEGEGEGEGEGDVDQRFSKSQKDDTDANDTASDFSIGIHKESKTNAKIINSTCEEDARSEEAGHTSSSPGYFEPDPPIRVLIQSEEIYSSLPCYPPRRQVPIGSDHQANIPVWGPQNKDTSDLQIVYASDLIVNGDNRKEFMGTCVITMPSVELFSCSSDGVGEGRTHCNCPDCGSMRCARQHIMEAGEKLRGTLGLEKFVELGFCDMGEVVAQKWSEEEEHIFHEVVFSNPVSSGRNFWDHLLAFFPTRTKKDLVSYYFNVFMLRRRAEQNRSYPLNIDSDNDGCQESDDEDRDSVADSPIERNYPIYNQLYHKVDFYEEDEEGVESSGEDRDVQDNSCTSYDCQPNDTNSRRPAEVGADRKEKRVESDCTKHVHGSYDGLSSGADQGYILEPLDAKVWDFGYLIGPKKDVDFLPTCNMIEEVFGRGSWNNNARNGKGIS